MQKLLRIKYLVLAESLIILAGIIIFSSFSHNKFLPFTISLTGLFVAAIIMARNTGSIKKFKSLFGFNPVSGIFFIYLSISLLFGILLGIIYNNYQHNFVLPGKLTHIAILAALIGSLEELIFRGFLQGYTRQISILFSICFATFAHTVYKSSLFIFHHSHPGTDIIFLMKWTIIAGIVFSIIREYSNNIFPSLMGHAIFDIIVYGDYIYSPWWVFS